MSPAPAAGGPEVVTETRWLIVWPNGEVYGSHEDEAMAESALRALTSALASYTVPKAYFPAVKRRRRTITKTRWEDA